MSSNCIVRLIKSMLVQKTVEEFRASNQVSNGGFLNLFTLSISLSAFRLKKGQPPVIKRKQKQHAFPAVCLHKAYRRPVGARK